MPREERAPRAWRAAGGGESHSGGRARPYSSTLPLAAQEVALAIHKRGKLCVLAKLVMAKPLGQLVLTTPYRNRQAVDVVSLPPVVLAYAREAGARMWVVRFDRGERAGECWALPLAQVEEVGWLKTGEWFVPLEGFGAIPWQDWPFVEHVVTLGVTPDEPGTGPGDMPVPAEQLSLFGMPGS